jgi:DNA adenine methylase
MNPILNRVGGKFYMRKKIIKLIPEHDTYVEPFVGGGSIFYGKTPSKKEVINDLDTHVYMCHLGGKENDFPILKLKLTYDEFHTVRKAKPTEPSDVLLLCNLLQKNSFLSTGQTYYDPSQQTENGRKAVVANRDYPAYRERLKDTIILNTSYENVIKEYDSPTTFFYLDPPYENSKKTTSKTYQSIDYTQLSDILKNIQGKFLLSINDSPFIREVFKDFTIDDVDTRYCLKERKVSELFIKNY